MSDGLRGLDTPIRGLCIDLDGTLLDTAPDLAVASNAMLAELGRDPLDVARVATFVGKGADVLIQRCLAATGGVHGADDALKMLLAGADVVHMASALLQNGPQCIATVLEGMTRWMSEREYESVAQLKGSMSQRKLTDPSAFARAAYLNAIDSFTPPPGVRY